MLAKKEYQKQYRKKHYKELKKYIIQWRKEHYERMKECQKRYHEKNREKINTSRREYYERTKNYEVNKSYYKNNQQKIRKHKNHKYRTDLKFNLNYRVSSAIWHSLKGNKKGRHWEILVGYTLSGLKQYLNETMPEGYTWQDFMQGKLHIDHIVPISAFNFTKSTHIDFNKCWALKNLRLLPARENLKKYNKLNKPFQPALAF